MTMIIMAVLWLVFATAVSVVTPGSFVAYFALGMSAAWQIGFNICEAIRKAKT